MKDPASKSSTLFYGSPRSARSAQMDRRLCERWGRSLLLVPTRQAAARRLERIVLESGMDGVWGRRILTFDDFAVDVVRKDGIEPALLSDLERRFLFSRTLARVEANGGLTRLGDAAATEGFAAHALRLIAHLKQAAVEPEEFRDHVARRRSPDAIDSVVADLYEAYQQALKESSAYDVPGIFWEAYAICSTKRPAALQGIECLMLDGFDDFTPSEFRLLDAVAAHVDTLAFGLNYDPRAERRDAYALSARTVAEIVRRFDATRAEFEESDPKTCIEFASSHLFWRDRPPIPKDLAADLEILPCADETQEVETIGRRIKALMADHAVPPETIAVIFRNPRAAASLLRPVFDEFEIPLRIEQPPTLWDSSLGQFLLTFFDAIESWRRQDVLDALASPWFPRDEASGTFPLLARAARIVAGRDEWRRRLEHLRSRLETPSDDDIETLIRTIPDAPRASEALSKQIETLATFDDAIPRNGAPVDFIVASEALLDTIEAQRRPCHAPLDIAARDAFRDLLGSWRTWAQRDPGRQSRAEFLSTFRQTLREFSYHPPQPRRGVICLDPERARHLLFDYVFVAGVNEGAFPRPPLANAIYSEEDLDRLREAGIPLEGRHVHAEREASLFLHMVSLARKRLYLTWHATGADGKGVLPSPFLSDLIEILPESVQTPIPPANAIVPNPGEAASLRDACNLAFLDRPSPPPEIRERFAAAANGAAVEFERQRSAPFGAYDGVLTTPQPIATLAERFGPGHRFSVDRIETYAACPFRFFVERVVGVVQIETPVAEFDPRVRGSIAHAALQIFHERFRGRAVTDIDPQEAANALCEAADRAFASLAWRSTTAPRGVEAVERARLQADLNRYLRIERDRNEGQWKPAHFEAAFGAAPRESREPLSTTDPFVLDTREGPIPFSGRIDRIDRHEKRVRLIDYKTSRVVDVKDIDAGRSIQLAVYALAVERLLLPGAVCAEAYYLRVGSQDRIEALGAGKTPPIRPERETTALDSVARAVAGIRAGNFPPAPETAPGGDGPCAYCPARDACRYEPGRIERKMGAS